MCPNWCSGMVHVKGEPKNIQNFSKLFIFEEEANKEDNKKGKKYFARSFIHQSWKDFKKEFLGLNTANFSVDFAWSCWSCIFEGYPNSKECVTLEWAMKKYKVGVEIETEEIGEAFEETIETHNGKPVYACRDMPEHTCYKCGNKQSIPTAYDLEDEECWKCEAFAWRDELQEMVKEKIEKIKHGKDNN